MSMSLLSNAYLDESSARVKSKPVPWEVVLQSVFEDALAHSPSGLPESGPNLCRRIDLDQES